MLIFPFKDVFDIIEHENEDLLRRKLLVDKNCVNTNTKEAGSNDSDWWPLDLALMLNNIGLVRLLVKFGALENPKRMENPNVIKWIIFLFLNRSILLILKVTSWEDRYDRVCAQIERLNHNMVEILRNLSTAPLKLKEITVNTYLKINQIKNGILF